MKRVIASLFVIITILSTTNVFAQHPDDKNWSDKFGYPGMMGFFAQTESNLALTYKDTAYFAANFTEFGQQKLSPIIKWDGKKYSNFSEGSYTPILSQVPNARIFAFAVDSTGNFYIGGNFKYVDGKTVNGIAMWNGNEWIALNGGCSGEVRCITAYPDGVYVGGTFDSIGGKKVNSIAKWDGSTWHSLDTGIGYNANGIPTTIKSIAKLDTELYVVANWSLYVWDQHLWKKQNVRHTTEDNQAGSYINAVTSDGKDVYICGSFDSIDGLYAKHVAKRENDSWVGIGNYTGKKSREVYYIGFVNNKLFVRGYFSFYQGNDTLGGMLLFDNNSWKPFAKHPFGPYGHVTSSKDEILVSQPNGYGFIGSNTNLIPAGLLVIKNDTITKYLSAPDQSGVRFGPISKIAFGNNQLYALGDMYMAGLQNADSLMSWDGAKWTVVNGLNEFLGSKRQNELKSITTAGDKLYVQGDFDVLESDTTFGFVMHDNLGWHSMYESDFKIYDHPIMYDYSVNQDGDIAAYSNYGITLWKNNKWTMLPLPYELNDTVQISVVVLDNGTLYVNYYFNSKNDGISTFRSNEILKWDGLSWQVVKRYVPYIYEDIFNNITPGGWVSKMSIHNGTIYISGFFTHIDSIRSGCIAGFKDNDLITFGKGVEKTKPYNSYAGHEQIFDIAFHNNEIYVGGVFDHAGDSTAFSVAKWDGNNWHSFGSGIKNTQTTSDGIQLNGFVNSMCIFDNKLYIAGDFERAGGKNAHNISYYNLPPTNTAQDNKPTIPLSTLSVYPNPTNRSITVAYETPISSLSISDELGRTVMEIPDVFNEEVKVDCSQLSAGAYTVKAVLTNGTILTGKFLTY